MRSVVCLSAAALLALLVAVPQGAIVSAEEPLESTLLSIEKSLWEGWKNQDTEPFKTHMIDESLNITAQGISSGKAHIIKEIADTGCEVKGYSLSEAAVHRVGKDSAILTYKAAQDAICRGQKVPPEVYVSSVYVNDGGTWRSASYQETPVAPVEK